MFTHNTILPLNFYKYKKPFTGSNNGKRYRIMYFEEENNEATEKYLKLWVWPEPYSFEKTDPNIMTTELFPFSDEGYDALLAYLNEHLV